MSTPHVTPEQTSGQGSPNHLPALHPPPVARTSRDNLFQYGTGDERCPAIRPLWNTTPPWICATRGGHPRSRFLNDLPSSRLLASLYPDSLLSPFSSPLVKAMFSSVWRHTFPSLSCDPDRYQRLYHLKVSSVDGLEIKGQGSGVGIEGRGFMVYGGGLRIWI